MVQQESYRVLLVDDDITLLESMALILSEEFSVRSANSGVQALRMLEREPFHVVCADWQMPGMDGVEFFRAVPASFSTLVRRKPLGRFSSRPMSGSQSHSSPPRRQTYTYATNTVRMKSTISTSPKTPRCWNATAHGYKKMISMSKTMKSIAVR